MQRWSLFLCGLAALLLPALGQAGLFVTPPAGGVRNCGNDGLAVTETIPEGQICYYADAYYVGTSGGNVALGAVAATPTMDEVFDQGKTVDGANSLANAACWGNGTNMVCLYTDGSNVPTIVGSNAAKTTLFTFNHQNQATDNWEWVNDEGDTCLTWNDTTYALTVSTTANCSDTLAITGNVSVTGTIAATGVIQGLTGITAVTTNPYTLLATDCGKWLSIETGAGEIDLLADMSNCLVCAYETNAVTLLVDPNDTDTWNVDSYNVENGTALAPAAGDRIQLANVAGNGLCFLGTSATAVRLLPGTLGTLTDAN